MDAVPANLSLLLNWATQNNEVYDVFVILSDNLLNATGVRDALKIYQENVSPKAKYVLNNLFINKTSNQYNF